ncbi:MAG TPA: SGNH/GDSL hydrolase family protein [Vicinamibacterales bacterium]
MNSRFARFAAAVAVAALVALPVFAARGSADFSNFVAIGDSYGAGFQSAGLEQNHQVYGWPAIIAKQVGYTICTPQSTATDHCFALPLISPPGLPGAVELQLNDIISFPPVIAPAPGTGQPLMLTFGRPYNDLAVPGYTVGATMFFTGKEANSGLGQVILRGLGTEVDQAIAQHPSFIGIWIGGNDFLGSVTQGTSAGLTSVADFTAQYNAMLDKLAAGAPNAGMVVGTLPTNPAAVPFLNTVPRFLINPATRSPVTVGGQPVVLTYDTGNGTAAPIPDGSFVTLAATSLLATGFGIPAALAPAFPTLPNAGKPLPGSVVITPDEFATIQQRILDYNSVIVASAGSHNVPVADIKGLFDRVANNAEFVGPFQLTGAFISGGFFSLDGIHLTDIGYTMFANEYIKAINSGYGTHIPLAPVANLLSNNGSTFLTLSGLPLATNEYSISPEAATSVMQMLQPKTTIKKRATHF